MQQPTLHTILSPRMLDIYDVRQSIFVIIDVFQTTKADLVEPGSIAQISILDPSFY